MNVLENDLGYKCVGACQEEGNLCRKTVDECFADNTPKGYRCEYVGCQGNRKLCPDHLKCLEEPETEEGFSCIDPCLNNDCHEPAERCIPSQNSTNGYKCQYQGCPPNDEDFCPPGLKCMTKNGGSVPFCVDVCYNHNCRCLSYLASLMFGIQSLV